MPWGREDKARKGRESDNDYCSCMIEMKCMTFIAVCSKMDRTVFTQCFSKTVRC